MTPTPATVSASTPPAAPAAAAPAAKPETPVVDFQKQLDELKEQNAELQRTAQYWADKAKAAPAPKAAKEDEEPEPDILETITTKGAKGFDEIAKKRGFVSREEVEGLINSKATALTKEQELISQYPDLKKKDSDFFKATALNYGKLVKDGTPQSLAMELAAERTELEFIRNGKMKVPGAEPTKEEKETARLARIAAQAGGGNGRPAAGADPEDDELTPEQKHIARSMGISEEAYAKRAKAGVAMRTK